MLLLKANDIYNNSVVAYNADKIRGIAADNSQNLNICGNGITRLGYALRFEGDCQTTRLKNNVMTDYNKGMWFELTHNSRLRELRANAWDNEWMANRS
jgi:hypothetical protein